VEKNSFGLLELEMADLERFWRKTPLGPLGVNAIGIKVQLELVVVSPFLHMCGGGLHYFMKNIRIIYQI
jgi:hypothetical protein